MQYIPDAIALTPSFNTPFTMRPDGLETVNLLAPVPGIGPEQINAFNPTKGDILQLNAVLNATQALPNLSDIQKYITATTVNGNTILSVDPTGSGHAGTAFAQLNGVTLTLAQLLADHALVFTPSALTAAALPGQPFQFRSEGNETALLGATFSSSFAGFGPSDEIVAEHFGVGTKVSFVENGANTAGTLTLQNGSTQVQLALLGQYSAAGFGSSSTSQGTVITYTPPPSGADSVAGLAASHH
jgi:hypothetical protein